VALKNGLKWDHRLHLCRRHVEPFNHVVDCGTGLKVFDDDGDRQQ